MTYGWRISRKVPIFCSFLLFLVYISFYIFFYVANVANEYINITIKKNIGKVMEWNATSATEIGKMK